MVNLRLLHILYGKLKRLEIKFLFEVILILFSIEIV